MWGKIFNNKKRIGFYLGCLIFGILYFTPSPQDLSQTGWYTASLVSIMAIWWIFESVPVAVTALLPIFLLPILDVTTISQATQPYANPLIFLFMGGFFIAIAMEKSNLHRRIALTIINYMGINPKSIILGFVISSAFLSMWISNTATALMMLPIALSILSITEKIESSQEKLNFEIALMLCIAYACNIGGMATLVGTPPNAFLAGFMSENYNIEIGFAQWLIIGVPIAIVGLILMYIVLTKVIYPIGSNQLPGSKAVIEKYFNELGPISIVEKKVTLIFVIVAILWIIRPYINFLIPKLSDAGIAIGGAISLFVIPESIKNKRPLLSWKDAKKLPWGILILFGGGLSLASAISASGLANWIGESLNIIKDWPILSVICLSVTIIILLTEITSNTATISAFLPILASVAISFGESPILLAIPASLGASCAFMLPVATPPNAIIFGSGKVSIYEMSKAGIFLNIIFIFVITFISYKLIDYIFKIV